MPDRAWRSPCARPSRFWLPRRIILGGGVSLIGEAHWFEPIRGLVEAGVFAPFRGSYDIVPAALGEQVVVHGALALAHDAVVSSS